MGRGKVVMGKGKVVMRRDKVVMGRGKVVMGRDGFWEPIFRGSQTRLLALLANMLPERTPKEPKMIPNQ